MSDETTPRTDGDDTAATQDTRTPEQIEADLARTREELSDTVEKLAAKVDVKTRSKQWAQDKKEQASVQVQRGSAQARRAKDEHGQELAIGAAVAAGVVLALVLWRARRR